MRIFWMDTKEGPTLPVLMVRPGLTIDDVSTTNEYIFENDKLGYASPEKTMSWFDATEDELWLMMNANALGPKVMNNQPLTLPGPNSNSPDALVSIGPSATIGDGENGYGNKYLVNAQNDPFPWQINYNRGVLFWQKKNSDVFDKRMYANMGNPSQTGYQRYRGSGRGGGISVLIRDDTGAMKGASLFTFDGELGSKPEYRDRPSLSTVYGAWNLNLDDSFWKNQTGEITDTGNPEPPDSGGIIDMTNRFAPKVKTNGNGVYPLTVSQVRDFQADLWDITLMEQFKYAIWGNPLESVVSLKWYYGIKDELPLTETAAKITLGHLPLPGITTKPVTGELMTYSFGEIDVPRYFNNFLDYSPFTNMTLYIPFVGFMPINATEIIGKKLRVDFNINLVTGITKCIVYIKSMTGSDDWREVQESDCIIGVDIPLNVQARATIESQFMTSLIKGGMVGGAVMAGGAIGMAGLAATANGTANVRNMLGADAAIQATPLITNNITAPLDHNPSYTRSEGSGSEAGSLGDFQPYLLIERPESVAPSNYNELIGTPDFSSGKLTSFTGYVKVGALSSVVNSIPKEAMDEITQLLKGGVYIE